MRAYLGLSLCLCLGLPACGEEDAVVIESGPTGEPSLAITSPVGEPSCVTVDPDEDERLTVLVAVEELLLRPPGACGSAVQCGHLALYANDVLNNESAVIAVDLLFRRIADRYHDGSVDPSGAPDLLPIAVEVIGEDGETLLDHAGVPLRDELDLVTVPPGEPCPGG